MSKRIVLDDFESDELPSIPVIEEVKQIRFTKDMTIVTSVEDGSWFMIQQGSDDVKPSVVTFENIVGSLTGESGEGVKKFITGDYFFKIIGDTSLLETTSKENVTSAINSLKHELDAEIDRSINTDEDHDGRIKANKDNIDIQTQRLTDEIKDRKDEDQAIRDQHDADKTEQAERDRLQDEALAREAETRKNADDAESQARIEADNEERARATAAEKAIADDLNNFKITQAAIDKQQDDNLAAESTRAQAAEKKNADDINAESRRAQFAESQITTNLENEIKAREEADANLTVKINEESERAKDAEKTNADNIAAEISRATTKEQELKERIEDNYTEITGDLATLEEKVDAEISRSTSRDDKIESEQTEWNTNQDASISALQSVSHAQNTDLGTTSPTFQLKYNTGNKIKHESDAISVRNSADTDYVNFIAKNATFKGDLIVEGQSFITDAETVEIKDNILLLNKGEVGSGVTKGIAGIEIDRGTEPNYQILFVESDNRFKAGEEGDLWCLALRDNDSDMVNGMFTTWDSTTKRLKTTNIIPEGQALYFSNTSNYLKRESHSYTEPNNTFSLDALTYTHGTSSVWVSGGSNYLNIDTNKQKFKYYKPLTGVTFYRSSDDSEVLYHADIINDVTSGGATKVLSAEQGKVLKGLIDGVSGDLSTKYLPLTAGSGKPLTGDLYLNSTNIKYYSYANSWSRGFIFNTPNNVYLGGVLGYVSSNTLQYISIGGGGYDSAINTKIYPSGDMLVGGVLSSTSRIHSNSGVFVFGSDAASSPQLKLYGGRIAAFSTSSSAPGFNAGSLLISSSYEDSSIVPSNGIYSKGAVMSPTGFSSAARTSTLNLSRTGNDVLHISSFAAQDGTIGYPTSDAISGQVINDGWALTYFWNGDFASQIALDIDGSGIAYRRYTPSTGASAVGWKFLADTNWTNTKLTEIKNSYLPLSGGNLTGSITFNNTKGIEFKKTDGTSTVGLALNSANNLIVGSPTTGMSIQSRAESLYHYRENLSYEIWDAYNLSSPASKISENHFTYPQHIDVSEDTKLYLKSTDDDNYNLITFTRSDDTKLARFGWMGSYLGVTKNGTNYEIWDKANLSDPAKLSATQTFTGTNTFSNVIKAGGGIQIGTNNDCGWYLNSNTITAGSTVARDVNVGSLLVSNSWGDRSNVPTNGIYSKGVIQSASSIMSGGALYGNYLAFSERHLWSDDLAPNKTHNALLQVLDQSGSTPSQYGTILQINSRANHWATQLYIDQTNSNTAAGKIRYRTSAFNTTAYSPFKVLATEDWVTNQISSSGGNYLPLSGGAMSGNIVFNSERGIYFKKTDGIEIAGIKLNPSNHVNVGSNEIRLNFVSNNDHLYHYKAASYYKVWDESNLANPVKYGTSGTTIYDRTLGVNGTNWTFLSVTTASTTSIYAPTTAGTSGQILKSSGGVPTWVDASSVISIPTASASVLGGVKIGSNITVSSGTISLTKANVVAALGYTPPTSDTNTTYSQATSTTLGLVKIGYTATGKNYPVQLDTSGKMYVNVPWTDSNTTYSIATASVAGLVKPVSVITKPTLNSVTTTSGKYYQVQMSSDGNMFVNVPWSDTNTTYSVATTSANGLMSKDMVTKLNGIATNANNYSLPAATSSVLGGVKTGSNITNSSGTISISSGNVTSALGFTPIKSSSTSKVTDVQVLTELPSNASSNPTVLYIITE